MPIISQQMDASHAEIQLTLSLFFIAFALMQLFWGPLSDRYGRKPIVLSGLVLFIISSVLAALSTTIHMLVWMRLLQAIGACSGAVMTLAITKDLFPEKKELTQVLRITITVVFIAPMIGPIIGSNLLEWFDWQANFYFLAIYGTALLFAACFIKESFPAKKRNPPPISTLLGSYWQQLKYPPFFLPMLAAGTNFSVMFSFIAASPFIYITIYHVPKQYFGYLFAINASGLIIATILARVLRKFNFNDKNILTLGLSIGMTGAVIMVITLSIWPNTLWSVAPPCFIATFGIGMLFAELNSLALHHSIQHTGITAALVGTGRYTVAGLASLLIGVIIHTSAMPLAFTMIGFIFITSACMFLFFRLPKTKPK